MASLAAALTGEGGDKESKPTLQESLAQIAEIIFRVDGVLGQVGGEQMRLPDIVLGIMGLMRRNDELGAREDMEGVEVKDECRINFFIDHLDLSDAIYDVKSPSDLSARCTIKACSIHKFEPHAAVLPSLRPAYCFALDRAAQEVLLVLRGTQSLKDALTDLAGETVQYAGGAAHVGMLSAARWFADNETSTMRDLLTRNPGYSLKVVGHSLGAGVGALLVHMLRHDQRLRATFAQYTVSCVGIAMPAVVSEALLPQFEGLVTALVLQHDCVPRFGLATAAQVKEQLQSVDTREELRLLLDNAVNMEAATTLLQKIGQVVLGFDGVAASALSVTPKVAAFWKGLWGSSFPPSAAAGATATATPPAAAAAAGEAPEAPSLPEQVPARGVSHPLEAALESTWWEDVESVNAAVEVIELRSASNSKRRVPQTPGGPGTVASPVAQPAAMLAPTSPVAQPAATLALTSPVAQPAATLAPTAAPAVLTSADLVHMFAPGKLYFLRRDGAAADVAHVTYRLLEAAPGQRPRRLVVCSRMITDHQCWAYRPALYGALQGVRGRPAPAREVMMVDDPVDLQ